MGNKNVSKARSVYCAMVTIYSQKHQEHFLIIGYSIINLGSLPHHFDGHTYSNKPPLVFVVFSLVYDCFIAGRPHIYIMAIEEDRK
jgi:hypothetical protein